MRQNSKKHETRAPFCVKRCFSNSTAVAVVALALAGCQTSSTSTSSLLSGKSESAPRLATATVQETTEWSKKWEANKSDPEVTLQYVARLRAIKSHNRALAVLEEATKTIPDSTAIKSEYGKQLLKAGKYQEASIVLQRAAAAPDANWQVNSTQGMVYDHMGRHQDAQAAYAVALQKSPNQIAVLNNLGLSQAQSGNLTGAEETLRKAYATRAGKENPRVRQNLALVVGLQGRYPEAREIAQKDLPPHMVEANMAYLRKMLAQKNRWQQLSEMDQTKS